MEHRSLEAVLRLVNGSVTDFMERPAKSPNDRGAYGDYPLHKVAIWGDVEAAAVLIENGADINARGEDDDTPLHRAVAGNHQGMIAFLLSRGADGTIKNRYGDPAVK
jgi:cytohesin